VLERWDGRSDVLVFSFGVGFEGASSGSVCLVAFRLLWCGLSQVARYAEQVFGVDFELGNNEISLNSTNIQYRSVNFILCLCFLFIIFNCTAAYDLKMAKHGRNMWSSSNQ
jgi:hypothetical protein